MTRRSVSSAMLSMLLVLAGCRDAAETGAAFEPTPVEPPVSAPVEPVYETAPPQVPADEADAVLPEAPGLDLPGYTTEASSTDVASTGENLPILRAVRVGAHDGFDRIVFEFDSDGLPQWHVSYIDAPASDCGSGQDVALEGGARLQVRFSGAHAHTAAGEPTSGPRRRSVGQAAVRELVRTCDFEAEVTWVAGVASRTPYRPRVLDDPSRLVIDIAH